MNVQELHDYEISGVYGGFNYKTALSSSFKVLGLATVLAFPIATIVGSTTKADFWANVLTPIGALVILPVLLGKKIFNPYNAFVSILIYDIWRFNLWASREIGKALGYKP